MSEKLLIAINIINWLMEYKFRNNTNITVDDIMLVRSLDDEIREYNQTNDLSKLEKYKNLMIEMKNILIDVLKEFEENDS